MNTLLDIIIVIQVVAALAIIGLVLLQHGKGADMGAAFGSGASGSLVWRNWFFQLPVQVDGIAAAVFFGCDAGLGFPRRKHPAAEWWRDG